MVKPDRMVLKKQKPQKPLNISQGLDISKIFGSSICYNGIYVLHVTGGLFMFTNLKKISA